MARDWLFLGMLDHDPRRTIVRLAVAVRAAGATGAYELLRSHHR